VETDEGWRAERHYFSQESMRIRLDKKEVDEANKENELLVDALIHLKVWDMINLHHLTRH